MGPSAFVWNRLKRNDPMTHKLAMQNKMLIDSVRTFYDFHLTASRLLRANHARSYITINRHIGQTTDAHETIKNATDKLLSRPPRHKRDNEH